VSSRERKRAERRKRKGRSAAPPEAGAGPEAGDDADDASSPTDLAAAAESEGVSRSELKNRAAREQLEPLEEGERPLVVTIGAVLSLAIAISIVVAWLAGVEVQVGNTDIEERPSASGTSSPNDVAGPRPSSARAASHTAARASSVRASMLAHRCFTPWN